ncbi:MAG: hypothetical protein LBO76_05095 [Treponema sp.]|jgi:hypothetical protein|nr:hypothetical protein [Treponema sp.]
MRSLPFWFAIMLCAIPPLGARDVTVTVVDGELGMPLEGAEIRSYDGTSGQGDGEGRVVLTVPDDRAVDIRGSYPGYGSERLTLDLEHDEFVLELYLAGTLEARELVLEESRDVEAGAPPARAEVPENAGIQRAVEPEPAGDAAVPAKPLPGVGYSGLFNAAPDIRGAGELMAVTDGFYIENPYHWGGGSSIFDVRMLESARISRGAFSARYGHTVSGLLDVSLTKTFPQDPEFELGLSTSMADASLSLPFNRRGGVTVAGRLSYYGPVLWAARGISGALEALRPAETVSSAPYIRSAALRSGYRFTDSLELGLTGFFGADGAAYDDGAGIARKRANYQGFGFANLAYKPRGDMTLTAGLGAGYRRSEAEDRAGYSVKDIPFDGAAYLDGTPLSGAFSYEAGEDTFSADSATGVQGRLGFDWDLGRGFLASLGVEGLYSLREREAGGPDRRELPSGVYYPLRGLPVPSDAAAYVSFPAAAGGGGEIRSLGSSAYLLAGYGSPGGRFGAELGLRLDHAFFTGEGVSAKGPPALSPRLSLDFGLLKNLGPLDSLSLSLGAGLFSSSAGLLAAMLEGGLSGDYPAKPDRSFAAGGGLRIEFSGGAGLGIDAYYRRLFDRAYTFADPAGSGRILRSDGQGRLWGIGLMLKKPDGRYVDGWIAYSFSHARYREPEAPGGPFAGQDSALSADWYYPPFHRFHVLSLALSVKPLERFAVTARLGFAGGEALAELRPYSVTVLDDAAVTTIQKWGRIAGGDGRASFSIPLDIKFSFFSHSPHGKARQEFYAAVENALSPFFPPAGDAAFNPYTGERGAGFSYALPVPILSFGFRWAY